MSSNHHTAKNNTTAGSGVNGGGDTYKGGAIVIQPQYRLGVFGFLGGDALRTPKKMNSNGNENSAINAVPTPAKLGEEDDGSRKVKTGTSGNWASLDIKLALEWYAHT